MKIVAVDLQLMAPIPGVVQIHGDITKVTIITHNLVPTFQVMYLNQNFNGTVNCHFSNLIHYCFDRRQQLLR